MSVPPGDREAHGRASERERTHLIAPDEDPLRHPTAPENEVARESTSPRAATRRYRETIDGDGRRALPALEAEAHPAEITHDGHPVVDRDRELERQEHLATHGRMRRLMPLAAVLWMGFFFVDWVLAVAEQDRLPVAAVHSS